MQFRRFDLNNCHEAKGTAVVIDVLRAFTTAAYAFHRGAESIILVGEVEEALALKMENPERVIMGEVQGFPVAEFDYGNSPTALNGADLRGKQLVQRTSSGTQGVVKSLNAGQILTASFVCARATADYLQGIAPETVSFVITGVRPGHLAEEDVALADYLEALLTGQNPDPRPYLQQVREGRNGRLFTHSDRPDLPPADLELAVALDKFPFAMEAQQLNGHSVLRPVNVV